MSTLVSGESYHADRLVLTRAEHFSPLTGGGGEGGWTVGGGVATRRVIPGQQVDPLELLEGRVLLEGYRSRSIGSRADSA